MMEVAFIKLCRPEMEVEQDTLLERIRALEEQIQQGIAVRPQAAAYAEQTVEEEPGPKVELTKALHEDVKAVAKDFRPIVNQLSGMLRNCLKMARLSVGNQDQLLIVLPDEVSAGVVGTPEHREEIEHLIEQRIGKTVAIEVRCVEEGRRFEDSFVDIEKVVHMDITVED